jgi:hypothetical protein
MARLGRAEPSGPGQAPGIVAGVTEAKRWTGESSRRRRLGWQGASPLVGGGPARCLSVGDARRGPPPQRRSPAPATRRSSLSRIPVDRANQSDRAVLPRRAILSPRNLPVKGATACGLRVPPLRSGQTPDSELPRQEPAPAGRTGKVQNPAATRRRPPPRSCHESEEFMGRRRTRRKLPDPQAGTTLRRACRRAHARR